MSVCPQCEREMTKQVNKRTGAHRLRCVDCPGPPDKKVLGLAISKQAMAVLSRWAECEFYVYIRVMTSRYDAPGQDHQIIWNVSVEYRNTQPGHWRASGPLLNELILTLDRTVPRSRNPKDRFDIRETPGWLATDKMQRAAIESRRSGPRTAKRKRKVSR